MKMLIIHGPNLNLLGHRKPEIYGNQTLDQLNQKIKNHFPELELEFFQSNHEGELIDKIHQAMEVFDGIVLNAGAIASRTGRNPGLPDWQFCLLHRCE